MPPCTVKCLKCGDKITQRIMIGLGEQNTTWCIQPKPCCGLLCGDCYNDFDDNDDDDVDDNDVDDNDEMLVGEYDEEQEFYEDFQDDDEEMYLEEDDEEDFQDDDEGMYVEEDEEENFQYDDDEQDFEEDNEEDFEGDFKEDDEEDFEEDDEEDFEEDDKPLCPECGGDTKPVSLNYYNVMKSMGIEIRPQEGEICLECRESYVSDEEL